MLFFKVTSAPPYPALNHLLGRVGYVQRTWGTKTFPTRWCRLPFVPGVEHGVKLAPNEIEPINILTFLWGIIVSAKALGKRAPIVPV